MKNDDYVKVKCISVLPKVEQPKGKKVFSSEDLQIENLAEEELEKIVDKVYEIQCLFLGDKDFMGVSIGNSDIVLVFEDRIDDKKVIECCELLKKHDFMAKYKGSGNVDKRYIVENKFQGFVVGLPSSIVDKAICDFFDKYGLECEIIQKIEDNCVIYQTELEDNVGLMFIANDLYLAGAITGKNAHITIRMDKEYLDVIGGVENDYLEWQKNHNIM